VRHNCVVPFPINGHEAQRGTNGAGGRRTDQPPSAGTPGGYGEAAPRAHARKSRGVTSSRLINCGAVMAATVLVIVALAAVVPFAVHSATTPGRPVAALSGTGTTPDLAARPNANRQSRHKSLAGVPPELQTAIDETLASQPVSSPSGISLSWGKAGAVSFRAKASGPSFGLQPLSVGRTHSEALTPGPFVFGTAGVTESLGHGLNAWYKVSQPGFEQGFTVARRPAGSGGQFSIVLRSSGSLHVGASRTAGGAVRGFVIASPSGPVLTYGSLRATDASGKPLPSHLSFYNGRLAIVVSDAGATYPVKIDPYVAPAPSPAATFDGSSDAQLGWSVALSADGQVALVGAPFSSSAGLAYLYTEPAGGWDDAPAPAATFSGAAYEEFGLSVALSADGQTAVVGAPDQDGGNGAAYVYTEPAAGWAGTPSPAATFVVSSSADLGRSVALAADGRTALVGAPVSGTGGAAYLYTEPAGGWSGTPSPAATFTGTASEELGWSVALSDGATAALVGAPVAGSQAGAAYLYTEPAGGWSGAPSPAATFTGTAAEELGSAVALSGDGGTALVGAPMNGTGNGAAYVYAEPAGGWSGTASPAATFAGVPAENLGSSVALSADSETALVGAPQASSQAGAAYVYTEPADGWSGTPSPAATFTGTSSEKLGWSVALSADAQTALVGAPRAGSANGAAYAYTVTYSVGVAVDVSGSQTYGSSTPSFTYTDNAAAHGLGVTGTLSCTSVDGVTRPIGPSLPAGGYNIASTDCSGLSLTGPGAPVDSIAYSGVFTVLPAALSISASSASFTSGGATPEITASYGGFVNNEDAFTLSQAPTCSTTATSSSPVGSYLSSCSGAADPNYSIAYVNGTVTVEPAQSSSTTTTPTATTTTVAPVTTATATTTTTAPSPLVTIASSPTTTTPPPSGAMSPSGASPGPGPTTSATTGSTTVGSKPGTATSTTSTTTPRDRAGTPGGASSAGPGPASKPRVTALSPAAGPETGGSAVVVRGQFFAHVEKVSFGAREARFKVLSSKEIRVVAPSGSGPVAVVVRTVSGVSSDVNHDLFTYLGRSQVLHLSPGAGPKDGGSTVVVRGSWFDDVSAVRFGSHPAHFKVLSSNEIRAVAPRGNGTVAVMVTTAAGTSPKTKSDRFTYLAKARPHRRSATTAEAGDHAIVVRVKALKDVVQLRFGTHVAHFEKVSADEMRAVSRRGNKTLTVLVTTAGRSFNERK
jgi:MBG domain (YGX type)/FG-GAP repeat